MHFIVNRNDVNSYMLVNEEVCILGSSSTKAFSVGMGTENIISMALGISYFCLDSPLP